MKKIITKFHFDYLCWNNLTYDITLSFVAKFHVLTSNVSHKKFFLYKINSPIKFSHVTFRNHQTDMHMYWCLSHLVEMELIYTTYRYMSVGIHTLQNVYSYSLMFDFLLSCNININSKIILMDELIKIT